ncbi:DUF1990 domain-containing protein [Hymenobacter psychrophilus]|uniref:DUF1990 domain-containing protein n=1 Tax=Hymenobacter psychrophilus TaxID=651662 RepID=A0A1H3KIH5_9BACT|nr:DUF1990 domain-containing protein [Hymenobacter psychrophilus]SDY51991.1 protein of unknown function [Hymenobacter psychrophilus]
MPDRPALTARQQARLDAFTQAGYNFDPDLMADYTAATGWRVDNYETELPPEAPGPPVAQGSWAAACEVLRRYSFPPPGLITGIFLPDQPLAQRVMVLRAGFLGFSFWFGVRIGGVTDETRTLPGGGGQEQVWGYNYRTLEGHFERGQIEFIVHKNLATGRVWCHIHAVSQTGRIRNPFYWLGFKLFGRRLQVRFSRQSLERLKAQVEQMLQKGWLAPAATGPVVEPISAHDEAQEQLEKNQPSS